MLLRPARQNDCLRYGIGGERGSKKKKQAFTCSVRSKLVLHGLRGVHSQHLSVQLGPCSGVCRRGGSGGGAGGGDRDGDGRAGDGDGERE